MSQYTSNVKKSSTSSTWPGLDTSIDSSHFFGNSSRKIFQKHTNNDLSQTHWQLRNSELSLVCVRCDRMSTHHVSPSPEFHWTNSPAPLSTQVLSLSEKDGYSVKAPLWTYRRSAHSLCSLRDGWDARYSQVTCNIWHYAKKFDYYWEKHKLCALWSLCQLMDLCVTAWL